MGMTASSEAAASPRRRGRTPNIGLGLLLRTADMTFNRALRGELAARGVTFSQFQHLRHLWDGSEKDPFWLALRAAHLRT